MKEKAEVVCAQHGCKNIFEVDQPVVLADLLRCEKCKALGKIKDMMMDHWMSSGPIDMEKWVSTIEKAIIEYRSL